MMSKRLREFHDLAERYDRTLLATHPRFNHAVHIIHEDGSVLFYDSAFLMQKGDFIAVFTEHHGVHSYHKEDLSGWAEYERLHGETEELPD